MRPSTHSMISLLSSVNILVSWYKNSATGWWGWFGPPEDGCAVGAGAAAETGAGGWAAIAAVDEGCIGGLGKVFGKASRLVETVWRPSVSLTGFEVDSILELSLDASIVCRSYLSIIIECWM